ncbi:hypothetical protein FB45DRAFT_868508 [Roridomyces roridus]|uniref:Uncharacterized protein n=1 Tax=Roridomyces roridus TaxID=1738132 RepID=A0AAD7BQ02_9AGAR|nr:hypothetical protein FB45DRAFT_868508 [Roridomyces roridus]
MLFSLIALYFFVSLTGFVLGAPLRSVANSDAVTLARKAYFAAPQQLGARPGSAVPVTTAVDAAFTAAPAIAAPALATETITVTETDTETKTVTETEAVATPCEKGGKAATGAVAATPAAATANADINSCPGKAIYLGVRAAAEHGIDENFLV